MCKFNVTNNTKYDDKAITVVRKSWCEIVNGGKFKDRKFETDYPILTFHIDGNNLHFNIGKTGPGTYSLKNTGLYHSGGKLTGWWRYSLSLSDLGVTNVNL